MIARKDEEISELKRTNEALIKHKNQKDQERHSLKKKVKVLKDENAILREMRRQLINAEYNEREAIIEKKEAIIEKKKLKEENKRLRQMMQENGDSERILSEEENDDEIGRNKEDLEMISVLFQDHNDDSSKYYA